MATSTNKTTGGLQKLALGCGGILVAILVLEAGLQLGALAVQLSGRETAQGWLTSDVRLLAVGDSNTFGLYLDEADAYPSQLEASWNESTESPKVEVINLGYPSTNSSYLLASFERFLDTFRPRIALVQIGVNDYWTDPLAGTSIVPDGGGPFQVVRRYSRVYKLLYMIRQGLAAPEELEVDYNREAVFDGGQPLNHTGYVRYGDQAFRLSGPPADAEPNLRPAHSTQQKSARLAENLLAMRDAAGARGVEMVLLTYPSGGALYASANSVIRSVAETSGTPLVDLEEEFRRRCSNIECPEYLFQDQHANAAGYAIVAERARAILAPLLAR